MDERILTFSAIRALRNCRRLYRLRYIDELVPVRMDPNLRVGSVFHECLERWFRLDIEKKPKDELAVAASLAHIDQSYPNRGGDPEQNRLWHLTRGMFLGYVARYPTETFRVVAIEKTFECPIINPATGWASRSFRLAGKVDALVQDPGSGEYFIMEHKSASQIVGSAIDRLPLDFQVHVYLLGLSRSLGIPIAGVIYDVTAKCALKQRVAETAAEFEERRSLLLAKSRSGKTSAVQREAEPDDAFQLRVAEKYRDPEMFLRETLYVSQADIDEVQAELWDLTQQLLSANRTGGWYRNDALCFQFNRPCSYFPLCRAGGNPNLVENLYEKRPAHSELATNGDESPAF
jgi:hypothetical protein